MDTLDHQPEVLSPEYTTQDTGTDAVEQYPLPTDWGTFVCTKENIQMAWEKLSQFPILFDDFYRGNFNAFVSELIDPNTILLYTGDYGMVRVCNIAPFRNADIHLAFWDRRFKGRGEMCKQALRWLFFNLQLRRATICVPSNVYSTISFIISLGFRKEGQIRDAILYKGRFLDRLIFGLLFSDLFHLNASSESKDKENIIS